MQAILYVNSSDNRTINKALQVKKEIDIQAYNSFNVINPTFKVGYDSLVFESNYIYVPTLKRYYFIKNIEVLTGEIINLECTVDVLESFKMQYLTNAAILKRSEKFYNLYLDDPLFQALNKKQIQTKIIKEDVEFAPQNLGTGTPCFVLTVARGKKTAEPPAPPTEEGGTQ